MASSSAPTRRWHCGAATRGCSSTSRAPARPNARIAARSNGSRPARSLARISGVNALVIAPQWIGDAVMSEPLLARLAARGERLSVAALPWVAPVYRAMPQVGEVIELPFAHGRLDWGARSKIANTLQGRFDAAYVLPNSIKSALIPFLARIPRRVGYHGEGRYG